MQGSHLSDVSGDNLAEFLFEESQTDFLHASFGKCSSLRELALSLVKDEEELSARVLNRRVGRLGLEIKKQAEALFMVKGGAFLEEFLTPENIRENWFEKSHRTDRTNNLNQHVRNFAGRSLSLIVNQNVEPSLLDWGHFIIADAMVLSALCNKEREGLFGREIEYRKSVAKWLERYKPGVKTAKYLADLSKELHFESGVLSSQLGRERWRRRHSVIALKEGTVAPEVRARMMKGYERGIGQKQYQKGNKYGSDSFLSEFGIEALPKEERIKAARLGKRTRKNDLPSLDEEIAKLRRMVASRRYQHQKGTNRGRPDWKKIVKVFNPWAGRKSGPRALSRWYNEKARTLPEKRNAKRVYEKTIAFNSARKGEAAEERAIFREKYAKFIKVKQIDPRSPLTLAERGIKATIDRGEQPWDNESRYRLPIVIAEKTRDYGPRKGQVDWSAVAEEMKRSVNACQSERARQIREARDAEPTTVEPSVKKGIKGA